MSWNVAVRHELRGDLVCASPLYVGGWDDTAVADLAVARDGTGNPVVPGTSLAGALRAWLAGTGDVTSREIDGLFGKVDGQEGTPSRIRVDDAPQVGDRTVTQLRTGVGIDRNTRTAATGFLYEREVLPAGTRFAFRLVADAPRGDGGPDVAGAFTALTAALRGGQIRLGAARTRGLGRVRLDGAETRATDLSDRDGLRAWLSGTVDWEPVTAPAPSQTPGHLHITVEWRPVGSVLVKDSLRGGLVGILPLTATSADGKVHLLLPGSSVKGVLRAHAERIVRTLRATPAPGFLRETLDGEALPGVVGLFGRSPRRRGTGTGTGTEDAAAVAHTAGWRGALEVADCHSRGHVTAEDWNAVLTSGTQQSGSAPPGPGTGPGAGDGAGDPHLHADPHQDGPAMDPHRADRQDAAVARGGARQELRTHLDRIGADTGIALRIADHVAVDRWTGGAADSALFSVLEPVGTAWEPLQLTLDCARAGGGDPDDDPVAVALLLLLLRDLADGWLTFGFGATRGHGHITVSGTRFTGTGLSGPWAALAEAGTLDAVLDDPPAPVRDALARWADRLVPDRIEEPTADLVDGDSSAPHGDTTPTDTSEEGPR